MIESDSDPKEHSESETGSSGREAESGRPATAPSAQSKAAEPAVQIQKNSGEIVIPVP